MFVTSASSVKGYKTVKTLGLVKGNTVRARHLGKDVLAGLKNLTGGEIEDYTEMMAEAREQALDRMLTEARARGANAVIDVHFGTCYLTASAAEILVYGNAVVLEKHYGSRRHPGRSRRQRVAGETSPSMNCLCRDLQAGQVIQQDIGRSERRLMRLNR